MEEHKLQSAKELAEIEKRKYWILVVKELAESEECWLLAAKDAFVVEMLKVNKTE